MDFAPPEHAETPPAEAAAANPESLEPIRLTWPKDGDAVGRRLISPTVASLGVHVFLLLILAALMVEKQGLQWPMMETLAQASGDQPTSPVQDFPVDRIEDAPPALPESPPEEPGSFKDARPMPEKGGAGKDAATTEDPRADLTATAPGSGPGLSASPAGDQGTRKTGQISRLTFKIDRQQAFRVVLADTEETVIVIPEEGVDLQPLVDREVELVHQSLGPGERLGGHLLVATRASLESAKPTAGSKATIHVRREAPGGAMPLEVLDSILELAKLKTGEVLIDLGGSDGRIVSAAARQYGVSGCEYQMTSQLVKETRDNIRELGLEKLVSIQQADLLTLDLRKADVVCLRLPRWIHDQLLPQLEKMKPGARIVSHRYPIPGASADICIRVRGNEGTTLFPSYGYHDVYFYTLPLTLK